MSVIKLQKMMKRKKKCFSLNVSGLSQLDKIDCCCMELVYLMCSSPDCQNYLCLVCLPTSVSTIHLSSGSEGRRGKFILLYNYSNI